MGDIEGFARRMKEARERAGLKQKELAEKIGVSAQTVSAYEKIGKLPTLDKAVQIANVLGVSLDWLCGSVQVEAPKEARSKADTIIDLLNAASRLDLPICEDMEQGVPIPTGYYQIYLRRDNLRGFKELMKGLYKLQEAKSVIDNDDYVTLMEKRIRKSAAASNDFEEIPPETLQELDDDLPF